MKQHIPTTANPLPFTPKCLGPESQAVFLVKPLTQEDYDRLGFELFRFNISPITQETFRATVIDEIFELYGDTEGEKIADLMDEYWQSEDAYTIQFEEWRIRDRERLWDQSRGAPPRDQEPLPRRLMGARQRAKAQLFTDELKNRSKRMRDLTIEMQDYAPRQAAGISRIVLEGWTGLSTAFSKVDGIVPEDTFLAMKKEIGKAAVAELHDFIMSLGSIGAEEMGNSDLQPESELDGTGSPGQSVELEASDGPSTSEAEPTPSTSHGSQTLPNASEEIIASSSTSTSNAAGVTSKTDATQTAEG